MADLNSSMEFPRRSSGRIFRIISAPLSAKKFEIFPASALARTNMVVVSFTPLLERTASLAILMVRLGCMTRLVLAVVAAQIS